MAFVWTWISLPGMIATLLTLAVAGLVLYAAPTHKQNRLLALVFGLEAAAHAGGEWLMYATDVAAETYAYQLMNMASGVALVPAYLLFLATLDSPLSRPFRNRWVQRGLYTVLLAAPIPVLLWPDAIVPTVVPWEHSPWQAEIGPGFMVIALANAVMLLYGLAVALSAWQAAPAGSPLRERAGWYAVAFGVRDLGFALVFSYPLLIGYLLNGLDQIVLPPLVAIIYVPLLAYGILKTQLFDIDLRIKAGVRHTTVAAVFVVLFFLVSEGVEMVVSEQAGTAAGLVAAGGLALLLRPLERVAGKFADGIMPGVQDTADYRAYRGEELYAAALQDAFTDGEITEKERDILDGLRERLEVEASRARALEQRWAGSRVQG